MCVRISLSVFAKLTILTLCPGVAVMSQVHSLRLGYLSGQLGLLRVPLGLWILCSHSATHHRQEAAMQREISQLEAEKEWNATAHLQACLLW